MLTTRQVVTLLEAEGRPIRRDWVIEMCRKGKLPAVQVEGRWLRAQKTLPHSPSGLSNTMNE